MSACLECLALFTGARSKACVRDETYRHDMTLAHDWRVYIPHLIDRLAGERLHQGDGLCTCSCLPYSPRGNNLL